MLFFLSTVNYTNLLLEVLIMTNALNNYTMGSQLDARLQACIDACNSCVQACNECYDVCCRSEQVADYAGCLKILRDCADVCALVSQMIARNSINAKFLCSICANICDACAKACGKCQNACCQKCAEICKQCADACREACCC
jgi:hypothetical protein